MKIVAVLKRRIGKIPLYLWLTLLIFIAVVTVAYERVSGKVFENFIEFINHHFIIPLGHYYTPVNSVVYGLGLFLALLLISRLLTRLKVNVDSKFILSVFPYIFIGSAARALNDAGVFDTVLLVSPPIYFIVFGYALLCLLISLLVGKKLNHSFQPLFSALGIVPVAYLILQVVFAGVPNIRGSFLIFAFAGGSSLAALPVLYLANRFVRFESFLVSCLIIVGHLLDASATHVAVSYFGYFEQHPLPNFLTKIFGTTLVLIPIKFLALFSMIIVLDRYLTAEQRQLNGMIKLTLLILGFATGTRDFFRLAMLK